MLASSTRCLRSIAAQPSKRSASTLSDKFSLEALNGGKNPFQVSSDALLKPTPGKASASTSTHKSADAAARLSKNALKSEDSVKDLYSLDYLLGKTPVEAKEPAKKNPFDVPSAKLM